MVLTRDSLRAGWLQSLVAASPYLVKALSEEELRRSREAVLRTHPAGEDLWLFAYGSLIWNPAFHFRRREIARVHGLHRRFCLWTHLGRGTPERPGLVLGLEAGGSCRGVCYEIPAEEIDSELEIVWRREMVTGAYRPRWVEAQTASGPRRAVTFVINRRHERYTGQLSEAAIIDAIAAAHGPLGACADYLFNTAAHLEELGIADPALLRLCDAVRERQRQIAVSGGPPTTETAIAPATLPLLPNDTEPEAP